MINNILIFRIFNYISNNEIIYLYIYIILILF